MVRAQYRLVTEGLGVNHLRLVMGTSMGAMHTWMWGEMYPDFMDALMPLASAPVEIGGRNRMLRKMIMDSIRRDPNWNNGEYLGPIHGMIPAQFDYVRAGSVDEAVAALAEHGDDAKVLAGGQSLIPLLRLRLSYPEVIVDVGRVDEMRGVRDDGWRDARWASRAWRRRA